MGGGKGEREKRRKTFTDFQHLSCKISSQNAFTQDDKALKNHRDKGSSQHASCCYSDDTHGYEIIQQDDRLIKSNLIPPITIHAYLLLSP